MSKKIITYGTFDLFHVGHVRLLKRLSNLGDELIVGCSTDKFNLEKGKESILTFEERKEILESCKYVSKVIPENSWDQKIIDIKQEGISIFGIGDDWAGKFDFLSEHVEVVYLPRTQEISTTEIKEIAKSIKNEKKILAQKILSQLKDAIENI
jgi:glycerol-3-phosphate cytidylyltransferase